ALNAQRGKAEWVQSTALNQLGATLSRLPAEGSDEEQTDGKIANEAIHLLEVHKDGPFFLACGFFRPHTPYVAPKKYYDMYPPEKLKFAEVPAKHRESASAPAFGSARKEQDEMTDAQRRQALQADYAATTFMDAQVGVVLDALD